MKAGLPRRCHGKKKNILGKSSMFCERTVLKDIEIDFHV